ncbi:MAG: hypothetical protein R8N23_18760 [Reichenbachiella sp.]|uniref:hypothetical protein n=1 Tax=Reichenbachiella sp. TaxID=2184521 RepID=UPI002966A9C8|nr:hypothetical protein [Reichenbachiella sp.]MDW3211919.1 hypothetical protein [Reichenbachiella sp.]
MDNRDLLLSMQRALLGGVISPLRAVIVGKREQEISIKFVVERNLDGDESEILDMVVTEIASDYPLENIKEEIYVSDQKSNQFVGSNEILAFLRHEGDQS